MSFIEILKEDVFDLLAARPRVNATIRQTTSSELTHRSAS